MKKIILFLACLLFASPAFAAFQLSSYTVPATGVATPYWVISQVSLNPLKNSVDVRVSGYISSAAFIAGKSPATSQQFNISGATYNAFLAAITSSDIPSGTAQGEVLTEITGALQTNMLTLPFFSTATIVQ